MLDRAPQCLDYELSRSVDEPACSVLRITWTSAEDHLQGFRGGQLFPEFLAAIRPYVSDIEEMRHYERTAVRGAGAAVPTLHDWAGGTPALERLTTLFYEHVAMWLAEVFGGPDRYTRERGGYPAMLGHHLGKGITEQQRRRGGWRCCSTASTTPGSPPTRSSVPPPWATSSGGRGWRCPTHSPAPRWSAPRPCPAGAGASHRPETG